MDISIVIIDIVINFVIYKATFVKWLVALIILIILNRRPVKGV